MRGNLKLFELKSGRGEKLIKNILIISSSPRKKKKIHKSYVNSSKKVQKQKDTR